jgi:O-antigen/teichoic acid export membrane protein
MLTLAGGTAVSQGVVVLASPILTRLYTPDVFGPFSVFVSLMAVLACIATLRYELAIPLPENEDQALTICGLAIGTALLYTSFIFIPIFLFNTEIARLIGVPQLEHYLWLLPIGILGIGLYQSLYYWSIRKARYTTLSQTRIAQSLVMQVVQICAYAAGLTGLLTGYLVSRYAGISSLLRALPAWRNFRTAITMSALAEQARVHRRFPAWSVPSTLLNTLGIEVPMLTFSMLFSSHAVGLYALTYRVLGLPITLIGAAVADIFFSNAAEAHREGRLDSVVSHMLNQLLWMGLPAATALMLTGPILFTIFFGKEWSEAGELAIYATPWIFMTLLASPLSRVFLIAGRQHELFRMQLILFIAGITVSTVGYCWVLDFSVMFILFSVVYFLFYIFYLWRSLRIAAVRIRFNVKYGVRVGCITVLILVMPYKILLLGLPLQEYWHQLLAIVLCAFLALLCYGLLFIFSRWQAGSEIK